MILTPDQRLAMEASFNTQQNSTDVKRAVTRISSELWPNGRVPYVIDTSLGKQSAVRIGGARSNHSSAITACFIPPQAQEHAPPLAGQSNSIDRIAVSDLCQE